MSKIFLCHASEDKPIAESIEVALSNAGHVVFYDDRSLPAGGDYHDRILRAINACDLFIFLISRSSITQGKYTLTELKFAREKWRSPLGRVLPVNLHGIPTENIPKYLAGITILTPKGNVPSEVRASAEKILKERREETEKKTIFADSRKWWIGTFIALAAIIAPLGVGYVNYHDGIESEIESTKNSIELLTLENRNLFNAISEAENEIQASAAEVRRRARLVYIYEQYFEVAKDEKFYYEWYAKIDQLMAISGEANKISVDMFSSVGIDPYAVMPEIHLLVNKHITPKNMQIRDIITTRDDIYVIKDELDKKKKQVGDRVLKLRREYRNRGLTEVVNREEGVSYVATKWPSREDLNSEKSKIKTLKGRAEKLEEELRERSELLSLNERRLEQLNEKLQNMKKSIW